MLRVNPLLIALCLHFFGDVAGHHAVQLVVGVDMGALVGFVGLLIVLILGAGVFGLVGPIGVVRLIDLFAAVQAGGHIATVVDDWVTHISRNGRHSFTFNDRAATVSFSTDLFSAAFAGYSP